MHTQTIATTVLAFLFMLDVVRIPNRNFQAFLWNPCCLFLYTLENMLLLEVDEGQGKSIKFIRNSKFLVCPKTKTVSMQMLPAGSFN